jgi:aminopeptidase-like protein
MFIENPENREIEMFNFAKTLWPLARSLTGEGTRKTLRLIQEQLPELSIKSVSSGTRVLDWVVPLEWRVNEAFIVDPLGKKICDFSQNNLHLVGYSKRFIGELSLEELQRHLHSLPDMPNAIPYLTSYYGEDWGFCITQEERDELVSGSYKVVVDVDHFSGELNYGELFIEGKSLKEVFISTYICHPSMANNELSGICVNTFLAKILKQQENRYSYRFVFVPETIGSIAYISRNLKDMKRNIIAGFNVSCVGDNRAYSFLPSRNGNSLSDKVAKHCLKWTDKNYISYTWRDRGSDERQYCSPGVDLPVASIMRSKYGTFPEYHTSLDKLGSVVTSEGLMGSLNVLLKCLLVIEKDCFPITTTLGEPFLSRHSLYPTTLNSREYSESLSQISDFISLSDSKTSLLDIAESLDVPFESALKIFELLQSRGIVVG